ncbi:MAG: LysR family transcriptional regulator [Rhodospirillales bacterium]
MQLRHLDYFVALARERHFGRAAAACNITQSTLSAAIRQLEEEIGAPLIARDQRFKDFTAEGRTLLDWARRIIDERAALDQSLAQLRDGLSGSLRIGVVPAALPTIALLTTPFNRLYPKVTLQLLSRTSNEIQRALDEFAFDAGITYLDNEPLHGVRGTPLYQERYILLTPAAGPFDGRAEVTWREAAETPLCLLTPDMQNRRIIDGIFREVGKTPQALVETNSVMTLCSHIRTGAWSSVFPHNFLWVFGTPPGMLALPLVSPVRTHVVGLVVRDREPVSPIVQALEAVARNAEMAAHFGG